MLKVLLGYIVNQMTNAFVVKVRGKTFEDILKAFKTDKTVITVEENQDRKFLVHWS